jgi:hypothetical protein
MVSSVDCVRERERVARFGVACLVLFCAEDGGEIVCHGDGATVVSSKARGWKLADNRG